MASGNHAQNLKRILKQYYSMYGEYPKTKKELIKTMERYPEFKGVFEVRSYRSTGQKYKLVVYNKKFKQQHVIEDAG